MAIRIGFARCSTRVQDLEAQRKPLLGLGVAEDRTCTDHGLTGIARNRPGLAQALAVLREGDTLVASKLDRLARSVPDAHDIAKVLELKGVTLALGTAVKSSS
ncbi:MAG: recombinase family protein [Boseongicola sp. SB0677_bin_26]|nr:recombinase family protein [Boseongicola sp. SB0665_bin_10]MYG27935.1 recombinase family protein [Boseongicola sp. SB0677_bin_26]